MPARTHRLLMHRRVLDGTLYDALPHEFHVPVVGPTGSGVGRTGWIIDPESGIPRLVTAFVRYSEIKTMKPSKPYDVVVLTTNLPEHGLSVRL